MLAYTDLAWMASECESHLQKDGKLVTMLSTESMLLLQRRAAEWKVVHVHGSSRQKDLFAAHKRCDEIGCMDHAGDIDRA